jgi:hypothetical protein
VKARRPNLAEAFRAALLSGEPDGCWIETPGPLDTPCWLWSLPCEEYGYLSVDGKQVGAHRFAFETVNGPLGKLCALHRCDVRRCVRPSHLFAGSKGDNIRDAKAKGRTVTNEAWHAAHNGTMLRDHVWRAAHDAKLTDEQVFEIYKRRDAGEQNQRIANDLRVSEALVSNVNSGRSYPHLHWLR